jgi:glycosyltransferase involved in cell wall biosynthesis
VHIGFDVSQTGSAKAGCGYFAHALIKGLIELGPEHRYSLYPSFGDFYFDAKMPLLNPYLGRQVQYGPRHLSKESAREFWNAPDVEKAADSPDIIQSNNFWCPTQMRSSQVIYTLYDMGFAIEPAWTTEANRVGCFEGVFRAATAADWIVAISEASRDHFLSVFPSFPVDRIRVIYPCSRFADPEAVGKRPKALEGIAADSFWLNVGTIEPRKNQHRLANAYAQYLSIGGRPMPLVLAGGKGWMMEDFQQHLEALGIQDKVLMTGYVSDEELVWLYRNCYANLYPSLFEGFGLPVLEGMQFGAATIASESTSIPEVTGEAAIVLPPQDVESWAKAMYRLATDQQNRDRLSQIAKVRAGHFEWKQSAKALLELYKEAVRSPKRSNLK